jgi:hypothetical protein
MLRNGRAVPAVVACGVALAVGLVVALALAAPAGLQITVNDIPGFSLFVPVAASPGPTAGDILVVGSDINSTNVVAAFDASTAQPDASVGTGGVLPLPAGLPAATTLVDGVTVAADNTIFATFFASATIYVASWNAQGQLNSSFGSGGLATIASPSPSNQFIFCCHQAVAGGHLIVGAISSGGTTLVAIDPATGAVGTPVTTAGPSTPYFTNPRTMLVGPDGNLYFTGAANQADSSTQVFYAIFDPTTLAPVAQTEFPDGDSAVGNAVTFLGDTAWLGVSSTTGGVTSTHLWSAPVGSTSGTQGPTLPTQVAGDNQSFVGLDSVNGTLLDAIVVDQNPQTPEASSWALQTDGSTFGPPAQIGADNTRIMAVVPAPGGNAFAGFDFEVVGASASSGAELHVVKAGATNYWHPRVGRTTDVGLPTTTSSTLQSTASTTTTSSSVTTSSIPSTTSTVPTCCDESSAECRGVPLGGKGTCSISGNVCVQLAKKCPGNTKKHPHPGVLCDCGAPSTSLKTRPVEEKFTAASRKKTVTVTNTGDVGVQLIGLHISPPDAFLLGGVYPCGHRSQQHVFTVEALDPKGCLKIPVTFTAQTKGAYTGELSFTTDSVGGKSLVSVSLSGSIGKTSH